jgi:hypothetical protein
MKISLFLFLSTWTPLLTTRRCGQLRYPSYDIATPKKGFKSNSINSTLLRTGHVRFGVLNFPKGLLNLGVSIFVGALQVFRPAILPESQLPFGGCILISA